VVTVTGLAADGMAGWQATGPGHSRSKPASNDEPGHNETIVSTADALRSIPATAAPLRALAVSITVLPSVIGSPGIAGTSGGSNSAPAAGSCAVR
jgi:hypothetical protein